jgi:SpoVK/Ycf46/Vps4 family AAA+-type ATPase
VDLVLEASLQHQLERILLEQRQHDQLREHGFAPARRILLLGPPGTGKTMSARMLASQLRLPLFTIRLDGLITKFLGETAAKLRLIFEAMAELRGAYLFDEVDALAGERGRGNDVGEIRRVLNSFLQFLEEDESESLLVAASNHPGLLDRALFRRFDAVLNYPLPTATVVKALILKRVAGIPTGRLKWQLIQRASKGLSHSDITLAVEQAAKDCILGGRLNLDTEDLLSALRSRRTHLRQA